MIQPVVALDLASVATLVMCAKDVSSAYPSSNLSLGALPVAAFFAYWSATSFPSAPACAGTQRMVTLLPAAASRVSTSMAATLKRCTGPRASSRTLVMA